MKKNKAKLQSSQLFYNKLNSIKLERYLHFFKYKLTHRYVLCIQFFFELSTNNMKTLTASELLLPLNFWQYTQSSRNIRESFCFWQNTILSSQRSCRDIGTYLETYKQINLQRSDRSFIELETVVDITKTTVQTWLSKLMQANTQIKQANDEKHLILSSTAKSCITGDISNM